MADSNRRRRTLAAFALALVLGACASTPPRPAGPALGGALYSGRPPSTLGTDLKVTTADEARARAARAEAGGDRDLALYFLVRTAELDPVDTDALLAIGIAHESRGNAAQARRAYALAVARDAGREELRRRLALADLQLGLDDEALATLEPMAVAGNADWQVHDALGILNDRRGRHDAAQIEYALALERAPQSATTLNNRGYSRLASGDLGGAEADLRAALALGSFTRAWNNLGTVQARQGRYADSLDSFLRALPEDEALERVGEAALARQDYSIARDYLLRAAVASPAWFERAHSNLKVAEAHLELPSPRR